MTFFVLAVLSCVVLASGKGGFGGFAFDSGHAVPPVLSDVGRDVLLEEDAEDDVGGASGECSDVAAPDAGDPYLVPLRREATPVYRQGEVVSFKTSYSGAFNFGSADPTQKFRVVFDTGSGHVIVPSSNCHSPTCLSHRRYNVSLSATGTAVNMNGSPVEKGKARDQVTINFGTGNVAGRFVRESLCLGDGRHFQQDEHQERGPCVEMKAISAIRMTQQPFQSFKFDGVVGLGLASLALDDEFSFFDMLSSMLEKQGGGSSIFGFYLAESPLEGADVSEIAFGGYNPKRILAPLQWAPVAMKDLGYWQVEIFGVRIGNVTLDICQAEACRGIVDTGTSHLGVPGPIFNDVARGATVPASAEVLEMGSCVTSEGPDIEFLLDGFSITLRPKDYMRQLPLAADVNPGSRMDSDDAAFAEPDKPVGADMADGGKTCRPKLMPVNLEAPLGPNLFLLGEPVLKSYYTAFNWKALKVGFARAREPELPKGDGVVMMQTGVGVAEIDDDDDLMWEGSDNSFMVQMGMSVHEVPDDDVMY